MGHHAVSTFTYGEALTGVLKSMVIRPENVQSVCSILPGYRDRLRTWAVTNQDPGPRTQAAIKGKRSSGSAGRGGAGEVSLQQWEECEVSLGRLVTFLLPLGQSRRPEDEGAAELRD